MAAVGGARAATSLGVQAVGLYLDFAYATTRWRLDAEAASLELLCGTGAIVGFWHETLMLMPALLRALRRRPPGPLPLHLLISRHRDGDLPTHLMERMGCAIVRGSSGSEKAGRRTDRGGAAALRRMVRLLAGANLVGIAADGPRGPARRPQPGLALLARQSGAAFVPCAAVIRPALRLPGWDRARLPLPFARGAIRVGPPISLQGFGARDQGLDAIGAALDAALDRAVRATRGRLGG